MEWPWVVLWLLSLLIFSCVFTNLIVKWISNQMYKRYLCICKSFSAHAIVSTIKTNITQNLHIYKMFNWNYDNYINTLGNNPNLNKPKFYLTYVDDILAAFDKEQDWLNFLNFLNNKHPNIKFTTEKQVNHFHRFPWYIHFRYQ